MRRQNLIRLVLCAALAVVPIAVIGAGQAAAPAAGQAAPPAAGQAPGARGGGPPPIRPQVAPASVSAKTIDLMTADGSSLFGAEWRSMEAKIVEGPAIPNSLPEYKTSYDISPHAGEAGYDDSSWPIIGAAGLSVRRGGGKVSFIWYRAMLTVPAKIGDFDPTNATMVLTAYVDDYAEVWFNGLMPRRVGYPSPATIQGFNMPNRVILTESAKPGDKFQIAIFGINGPISVAPNNPVFLREAKVDFYR